MPDINQSCTKITAGIGDSIDYYDVGFTVTIPIDATDQPLQHLANRLATLLGRISRTCGVQPNEIVRITLAASLDPVFKKEPK